MGKRSRVRSSDYEYESIKKKFKKLEQKLLRARRKDQERPPPSPLPRPRSLSSSSSSSDSTSHSSSRSSSQSPPLERRPYFRDVPAIEYEPRPSTSRAMHVPPPPPRQTQPRTPPVAASPPHAPPGPPTPPPPSPTPPLNHADLQQTTSAEVMPSLAEPISIDTSATKQLNDNLIQLLGEDPSQKKAYGKDIQPDLAIRLEHIVTTGLSKEERKNLIDKYLPPANCTLIDAPNLNPESKAAITESTLKRDKSVEQKQRQIASAITGVAEALTLLFSSDQINTEVIKILMDVQKLLCDSQNSDSMLRRNFILFNVKKELRDQLQTTKIDKFLFSESLADTIKTAKAISKSGAEMKYASTKQPSKKASDKPQRNHFWRAAPQSHRSKGTQKNKEPGHGSRRETSSRPSSRPAPPPQRRGRR